MLVLIVAVIKVNLKTRQMFSTNQEVCASYVLDYWAVFKTASRVFHSIRFRIRKRDWRHDFTTLLMKEPGYDMLINVRTVKVSVIEFSTINATNTFGDYIRIHRAISTSIVQHFTNDLCWVCRSFPMWSSFGTIGTTRWSAARLTVTFFDAFCQNLFNQNCVTVVFASPAHHVYTLLRSSLRGLSISDSSSVNNGIDVCYRPKKPLCVLSS